MCLLANPEEKRENHMGTWQWIKACAKQNAGAQAQLKADVAKAYCGRKSCEGCKRCMAERTTAFGSVSSPFGELVWRYLKPAPFLTGIPQRGIVRCALSISFCAVAV